MGNDIYIVIQDMLALLESGLAPGSATRADGWKHRSSRQRTQLRMPRFAAPWCPLSGPLTGPFLKGVPVSSHRVRDVVNVAWYEARKGAREDVASTASNLFVNVSQNVDRVHATKGLGTYTRNATYYSFERDTLISSSVHMCSLGWPRGHSGRFPDAVLRDLSGDGVSMPLVMIIEEVLVANPFAEWWA